MDGLAARLGALAASVQRTIDARTAPAFVARPTLNALQEARVELQALSAASASPAEEQGCAALAEAVAELERQVAAGPWADPPALSRLRRSQERLADDLKALRRRLGAAASASNAAVSSGAPRAAAALAEGRRELPWWDPEAYANAVQRELDDVQSLLGPVAQELSPCWGIVHAAGTQDFVKMQDHTPDTFRRTFAPKAEAAWTLHQLRAARP
eukprot:TRINITY_DN46449_c0_g1_i1.p1 TRINITY_DN46449_c0_g1~~TRINITY_DN46449_c0_g1_i1.p1  ORF type:complete len:240 (-),score=58.21 TRINITY_DN46449_c0_g1_i1:65-703(-)